MIPKSMVPKAFKLFSVIFSYPTIEKIDTAIKLAREIGFQEIEEILNNVALQDLETEYTYLFVSSFPSIPCPPYQSYFEEGNVYGKASVRVREFYKEYGLDYVYESEPPDHISVELEFLSVVPKIVKGFYEWFTKFAECVRKNSELYSAFADVFMNFIESQIEYLEER